MSEQPPAPLPEPGVGAPAELAAAASPSAAAPEPTPLDVPLEEQITALPPLEFPGNPNQEFVAWAAERRRSRLRIEVVGAAMLVLVGVGASIFTGRPAFVIIAVFAVAGLAAYEFLVSSFE